MFRCAGSGSDGPGRWKRLFVQPFLWNYVLKRMLLQPADIVTQVFQDGRRDFRALTQNLDGKINVRPSAKVKPGHSVVAVIPFLEIPEPDRAQRTQFPNILGDLNRLIRIIVLLSLPGPLRIRDGPLAAEDFQACQTDLSLAEIARIILEKG